MFEQYYYLLSTLARLFTEPISNLADQINIPLVSVLLFGLIGAFAPCQLSTGVAALSFIARRAGEPRKMWAQTLAYLAGKATVYLVIGGVIVLLGLQLNQVSRSAIPVITVARKLLGPLLILVGLFLLGVLKTHFSLGEQLSARIQDKIGRQAGIFPAYLMGVAFSFTFCPTLFWLFFGLTIPLALTSPGGLVFPGVFALGTTLPLLFFMGLIATGADALRLRAIVHNAKRLDVWAQQAVGLVFVLIGLNEIFLYWFI
jgi:cytochrome c-type biogenesis protein